MRGIKALVIAAFASILIAILFGHRFVPTLIYTLAITLGCWLFIDGGRLAVARWRARGLPPDAPGRGEWPGWPWMSVILVVGTALGATFGLTVGDLLLGGNDLSSWLTQPRQVIGLLVLSLVPGVLTTLLFQHRGQLAAIEAKAQQARRQAAENQLRLLESQLEPHMLFNTLANLRVLIGLDPPRAQAMLDQLIAFLRAMLDASRVGRHALAAEFARLGDYLALMQVRMGARLQVRLDLPDELCTLAVPPLLLQPLVENAIKHGVARRSGIGHIGVSAHREHDKLRIEIRDDGVGLSEDALTALHKGIGVSTTRARLQHQFGADYRFEFHRLSQGVAVVVAIPWRVRPELHAAAGAAAARPNVQGTRNIRAVRAAG